jgi:Asp-tRNA(Asn)/Glu-tRNA(Gln) amidotransferase A subunit family amidase
VNDPSQLTATAAAAAIRRGDITSEALVGACLKQVERRDRDIGAWAHLDPAQALQQARAADHARAAGAAMGPLHGVPIGIKDIIDTADQPTRCGSPFFEGHRPERDAACVAALRAAGAVIIGKTVTTELATLTPSTVRNPLLPGHTPGGSSAGSAAAVAACMIPAGLGTQTAGSVLRPASYCGLYGFKPTLGLVSRTGVLMQSHTLDTVGLLTRSLDDVALLTDVMGGHDPSDEVSWPRAPLRLAEAVEEQPAVPPRLAFVRTPWEAAGPAMQEAMTGLADGLGTTCVSLDIDVVSRAIAWQRTIQAAENAYYYGPLLDRAPDRLGTELRAQLVAGCAVSVRAYQEAVLSRETAYAEVLAALRGFDAILAPAAPGPAPAGLATGDPVFNRAWTYLGMPTLTLPLLADHGKPMGVQLVGRRREDGALLRTARWLERRVA